MPKLVSRLAAASVAIVGLLSATAFGQTPPRPSLESLFKTLGVEHPERVVYKDQAGKELTRDELVTARKDGLEYAVSKQKRPDGDYDFTVSLITREQIEAMHKPGTNVKKGDLFPEFKLTRMDGGTIDNKSLAGRYTLLSFYFAECAPCIKEVPELNAVAAARKDLNFLAVTYDSVEDSKKFVANTGLNWPVVPQANALIHQVGIKGYPTLALLDPEGKVVELGYGGVLTAGTSISGWLVSKLGAAKQ